MSLSAGYVEKLPELMTKINLVIEKESMKRLEEITGLKSQMIRSYLNGSKALNDKGYLDLNNKLISYLTYGYCFVCSKIIPSEGKKVLNIASHGTAHHHCYDQLNKKPIFGAVAPSIKIQENTKGEETDMTVNGTALKTVEVSSAVEVKSLHVLAGEINYIRDQAEKILLNASIEIGKRMVEAKEKVAHGEWGDWLKNNVNYSQSTANNLMKVYKEYGVNNLLGGETKSQALSNLSYTQAVALLGVPTEEREEFVQKHDIENMSTRDLDKAVKENKELQQKLKASEETAENERKKREAIEATHQELLKKNTEHDEKVAQLNTQLEEAKSKGDEKEVEKLQTTLKKSKDDLDALRLKVKGLEEDLKKRPIEVPATIEKVVEVEKVPDSIQKELAELRAKVQKEEATKSGNTAVIAYRMCFKKLTENFEEFLGTLQDVEAVDKEAHEQYKKTASELLGKMVEAL